MDKVMEIIKLKHQSNKGSEQLKILIDFATNWSLIILKSNGSQSVFPGPASASFENL